MAFFHRGKKRDEEKNTSACACGCGCSAGAGRDRTEDRGRTAGAAETCCRIKVLGVGCKSCRQQYENAKQAVKEMGLPIEVEYITDMQSVMEYGVMRMPALVINENVAAMGVVLKTADIVALLRQQGF